MIRGFSFWFIRAQRDLNSAIQWKFKQGSNPFINDQIAYLNHILKNK